jgi:hypothetical protein
MSGSATERLRTVAQGLADALPELVVEIVLTGSVSRSMADELSDVEMLVVTSEQLPLEACFELARAAGLTGLDSWGARTGPTRTVFGYTDGGMPVELIWWSRAHAEARVDAVLAGEAQSTADALVHGVALRTCGLLGRWQDRLRDYPRDLAAARIESAALPWGVFAPAGILTITRPKDALARTEWLVDAATRVLTIVYALNRVWQPTTKRLAARVEDLTTKPDRLAERIAEALAEPDPHRALLTMAELQLEAVELAPSGPNIDRARDWLTEAATLLRGQPPSSGVRPRGATK